MTDGHLRLTLWQVQEPDKASDFDRRANIGLHHLALTIPTEADLIKLSERVANWPGVEVKFMPELLGAGPRKHMMFAEPGGIRIELIWQGE